MVEIQHLRRRVFALHCAASSLTQALSRSLIYLAQHEGIRQVELAELLEVQPITLAHWWRGSVGSSLLDRVRCSVLVAVEHTANTTAAA